MNHGQRLDAIEEALDGFRRELDALRFQQMQAGYGRASLVDVLAAHWPLIVIAGAVILAAGGLVYLGTLL